MPGNIRWAKSWENRSLGVCNQIRLQPACSATETSSSLETSNTESTGIILSRQWSTKALIRLSGYAGWSAHLMFAYSKRQVFSWCGSIIIQVKMYVIKLSENIKSSSIKSPRLNEPRHEKTCYAICEQQMRRSACTSAVSSAPLLFAAWIV